MRINFRSGAVVGIMAAAFSTLGSPVAAQAGQTPGTPVPATAGAHEVQAPAAHLSGITSKSVVLGSTFERPAWQRDLGIAQREHHGVGYGKEQLGFQGHQLGLRGQRLGLPGQQDRMAVKSYRCDEYGSWRYSDCRDSHHHDCWWRWGWYDHYGHYHYGWHWYCRYHDHYDHYHGM